MVVRLRSRIFFLTFFVTAFISMIVQPDKSAAATGNLAQGKAAYASSSEVDYLGPDKAVDGGVEGPSRWSSERTNDQWFYVDLGEVKEIGRVIINWQTPADKYQLLVSEDAATWRNVFADDRTLVAAGPVKETVDFEPTTARYVKFQGIERRPVEGITYGYSFWEFEVYAGKPLLPPMMEAVKNGIVVSEGLDGSLHRRLRGGAGLCILGHENVHAAAASSLGALHDGRSVAGGDSHGAQRRSVRALRLSLRQQRRRPSGRQSGL